MCAEPPISDDQKEERMFVASLQKIWWQVHDWVDPLLKPQNATHPDKGRRKGLVVSSGLSIFNDGVRPSSCAIDPVRLHKEG